MLSSASLVPSSDEQSLVLTAVHGCTGLITLNREKVLNALSLSMMRHIYEALLKWKKDPCITRIVIEGAGEKAFCAGGDIRSVYEAKQKGDFEFCDALFREEYRLNYEIRTYPKPYVALIRGICMGGGMGLSMHGSHRIVTENTSLAMPETTIGFFPDVGAGLFLNECPGKSGLWIGLLGERISAPDALYTGLATHFVSSGQWSELRERLLTSQSDLHIILSDFKSPVFPSRLGLCQEKIDDIFGATSMEEIILKLEQSSYEEAPLWLACLLKKSPTSLKLSLKSLRDAKGKTAEDIFKQEYRLSQRCVKAHDFEEGIRALLIDKDQKPRWKPLSLDKVGEPEIETYFDSLKEKEWCD